MPKSAPSTKPKAKSATVAKSASLPRKKSVPKKKVQIAAPVMDHGLVAFSFQDVDYQIDLEKAKVYRRFIEVEKSRTNSIISAYRGVVPRFTPTV